MGKYIDADLLRKDIDNWKEAMAEAVGEYSDGVRFALEHFTFVLDSLQQEQQEVDLDVDERERDSLNKLIAKCREGRDCKAAWEFYTKAKTEDAIKEEGK